MSGLADTEVPGLTYTCRSYGQHHLQRLGIWEYDSPSQKQSGHWIIYIHGGAWRDPRKLLDGFVPSIKSLISSEQVSESTVRGYVSIDYRLSPHSSFPQDPATTPASEFRGARHPDHIQDIRSALAFLKEHYHMSSNYILVGHSAGATLSYQLLMGQDALAGVEAPEVPLPAAIVAISGIYDIVALVKRFGGPYEDFVSSAFGPDATIWKKASPATYIGNFKEKWMNGVYNILAWSPEDTLVDEPEIDAMIAKLNQDGVAVTVQKDLTGDHDVCWQKGPEVANLIITALAHLHQS